MKVVMAVACDFAAEYDGHLCLQGTFDTLRARQFPFVKPHCSLAVQIQWAKPEEGRHTIKAHFMNEDGTQTLPDMESTLNLTVPASNLFITTSNIIHLQQLKFGKEGIYLVTIYVDNQLAAEIHIQAQTL